MKRRLNVLVFPGGTEIGLEIWRALRHCKEILLYSAAANVSNHAPYVFAKHFVVPSVYEPGWLDALNKIIVEFNIDYVFPAHDDVIVALAEKAAQLRARVISSPPETCLLTRSKSLTYKFFANVLPVPKIYEHPDSVPEYPVFVKPDRGQGAQGARIVNTREELYALLREQESGGRYLILEYLPGEEYTVDCLSDRERGLLFCRGRQRVRTRGGISVHSSPASDIQNEVFREYAEIISSRLALYGAWFFQVKKSKSGTYTLLEIAPRIAGTMALYRVLGVNFALLSIYEQERIPFEILVNSINVEIDRALVNRYKHSLEYRTVYIDLDDTLIQDGLVNVDLVRFLYQCVNEGRQIVLLTKHTGDVEALLRRHRLWGLFDDIIQLDASANKADYIQGPDAIFIDDSFSERKAVANLHKIPTLDCSMIEMLIDERV